MEVVVDAHGRKAFSPSRNPGRLVLRWSASRENGGVAICIERPSELVCLCMYVIDLSAQRARPNAEPPLEWGAPFGQLIDSSETAPRVRVVSSFSLFSHNHAGLYRSVQDGRRRPSFSGRRRLRQGRILGRTVSPCCPRCGLSVTHSRCRESPESSQGADTDVRLTTRRIKHKYNSKVMTGFAGTFSDDVKAELEKVSGGESLRSCLPTKPAC